MCVRLPTESRELHQRDNASARRLQRWNDDLRSVRHEWAALAQTRIEREHLLDETGSATGMALPNDRSDGDAIGADLEGFDFCHENNDCKASKAPSAPGPSARFNPVSNSITRPTPFDAK